MQILYKYWNLFAIIFGWPIRRANLDAAHFFLTCCCLMKSSTNAGPFALIMARKLSNSWCFLYLKVSSTASSHASASMSMLIFGS